MTPVNVVWWEEFHEKKLRRFAACVYAPQDIEAVFGEGVWRLSGSRPLRLVNLGQRPRPLVGEVWMAHKNRRVAVLVGFERDMERTLGVLEAAPLDPDRYFSDPALLPNQLPCTYFSPRGDV